jgi:hypothetical protein
VWSAEKRTEGLEYMHPKPSSHSGRIVGKQEVMVRSRHLELLPHSQSLGNSYAMGKGRHLLVRSAMRSGCVTRPALN